MLEYGHLECFILVISVYSYRLVRNKRIFMTWSRFWRCAVISMFAKHILIMCVLCNKGMHMIHCLSCFCYWHSRITLARLYSERISILRVKREESWHARGWGKKYSHFVVRYRSYSKWCSCIIVVGFKCTVRYSFYKYVWEKILTGKRVNLRNGVDRVIHVFTVVGLVEKR